MVNSLGLKIAKSKYNTKGFTLSELLIVVAIIAVLVAIAIPIFTSQLEKSRESTDAANIRSAYAEVMAAATMDDKTSSLWDGTEWKCAEQPLKQKTEDWQTDNINESLNNLGTQDGVPASDGTFYVTFNPNATEGTNAVTIHYSEGSNAGGTTFSVDWPKTTSIGVTARNLLPAGVDSGIIYSADGNLTADQQTMINDIKAKLGITGDVAVWYGWSGYPNIKVSIVEQGLSSSDFETNGKYSDGTYATRINYNPNTGEISKVTKEYGKWGNNAGRTGFWANDMGGQYPTEVLYEKS